MKISAQKYIINQIIDNQSCKNVKTEKSTYSIPHGDRNYLL